MSLANSLHPDDRLIWVDVESTGLDPVKEVLLEVGFRVTNLDLVMFDRFSLLIWEPYYERSVSECDPYVKNMHTTNSLFEEARYSGMTMAEAAEQVSMFFDTIKVTKDDPLCGSSVQFDREWLTYFMPECMERMSYRNVDISTVKELCRRYNPDLYAKLAEDIKPMKLHRVQPDLTDTIEEFEFYRDNFLYWKD